ncbi:lycopene cyclase family protein [Rhodococcus rhodochrous]|uniref:lycopene cyclase family protein n=1 Tax=Rhodococcus rhodochrous TaxID=1829 RepID=UPI001E5FF95B|nr:lycopene cyclase family protein [Rhodococcus rhodochrous]MCD2095832.1 lycopene cyclase [Rhodococcus rhodochrous]MCD2119734.1 lycopene cyclase [Rhodococcus rhodochrous]MCQ4135286.1 lycopene cyclase family protein [Rhodococcus rhodochrous]MDJ0020595.1 lycopene cyclase family protein [Rhodococcus rhodochrous]
MTHLPPTDLVVAGLGPAGRALAFRAAAAGLSVTAVDVRPQRRWTATYAAWADELPAWLPDEVVAAHIDSPAAWTTGPHTVDRAYRVLDTTRLQEFLALDEVTVVTGRVRDVDADGVVLGDGRRMPARYVVDARGVPADPGHAQQTAFGLIVDDAIASPALDGHAAWFMDWRRDNGTGPDDVPSFLYAVPAGDGRTIVEETCLVGRPALGLGELERRLHVRLEARGVRTTGDEVVERVRFAVEGAPTAPGVVGFGARGGLMHPATGYAVATALSTADAVVDAMRRGEDPDRVLWPVRARSVATLRQMGLRALLRLDARGAIEFFDAFFALPVEQQRAYLSGRDDATGVAATMWRLFRVLPMDARMTILRSLR